MNDIFGEICPVLGAIILKSDSHSYQIKIFASFVRKLLSFACLVFENENKWILNSKILFSWKTDWFKNIISVNELTVFSKYGTTFG